MYQYTFDEETIKKINQSTNKNNEILKQFDEINKKYDNFSNKNTSISLERMNYEKPSEHDVNTKAENNLIDYKSNNINSINEKYDTKIENINENIENINKSSENDLEKIKNTYESIKEDEKNDAIKRGLARSSIIVNKLSNLDNGLLKDIKEQQSQTSAKIDGLNEQKSLLEQQKQNALNSFDMTYAVKLQNEIDNINSDIAKREQEVIKYNNQIAEIEAKWERQNEEDFFDRTKELNALADEYGSDIFKVLKQSEKANVASKYFDSLDRTVALAELQNNPVYKEELGTANFNRLVKKYSEQ